MMFASGRRAAAKLAPRFRRRFEFFRYREPFDMGAVLLTGATGFVGGEVLTRFLEQDGRRVYALVRAKDDVAAAERLP
jgi:GDP-D-mannose dehydratase